MSNIIRTECILQWPMLIGNATFVACIQFSEPTNNKDTEQHAQSPTPRLNLEKS